MKPKATEKAPIEPMHILGLSVTDFKAIEAVYIEPQTGKPVIVTGDNGAGKSSVLDSIMLALTNCGVVSPIRHGAPKTKIVLKLGASDVEYTVERTVTQKGESLIVKNQNGEQVPKAQTFLDSLIGAVAIDPLEFMDLKPKEQALSLQDQLGLTAAMKTADDEIARLSSERTDITREVKGMSARLDQMKPLPAGDPDEPVDVRQLMEEAEAYRAIQTEWMDISEATDDARKAMDDADKAVADLEKKLAKAKKDAKTAKEIFEQHKKEMGGAQEKAEQAEAGLTKVNAAIANATNVNEQVTAKKTRAALNKEVVDKTRTADHLTQSIEALRMKKLELVRDAKMPVKGLELADEGLTFEGVPLADLNTAKRIEVCAAIAMANEPTLRVVFIKEGALINRENLAIIANTAEERGFQVWMEIFSETARQDSIHISHGAIESINGKKA